MRVAELIAYLESQPADAVVCVISGGSLAHVTLVQRNNPQSFRNPDHGQRVVALRAGSSRANLWWEQEPDWEIRGPVRCRREMEAALAALGFDDRPEQSG